MNNLVVLVRLVGFVMLFGAVMQVIEGRRSPLWLILLNGLLALCVGFYLLLGVSVSVTHA